jgi:hypothetical protein
LWLNKTPWLYNHIFFIHFFLIFLWYWDLNSGPSPWATPPALFCEGFFEIGSLELFAWADFEQRSYWSLPPEKLGLQVWATGTWLFFHFLTGECLG